ncbi:hypothetical protein Catovirus_1_491 [Catovirus CTV1]|mgnify:CR=1 FL=1|uniref:Uncharacterized protein n=1 Tax=Catovirus CTV1 TaxID=1977631 RepID=A0A1V0S9S5_9VIRU|nr:hypothetical protein Catovirus_1_491 [Catovirus CTV1]
MENVSVKELNSYLEYLDILKEYVYTMDTNKNTEIQINELKNDLSVLNFDDNLLIKSIEEYDEAFDKVKKLSIDKKYKMMQALNLKKNILECENLYKTGCQTIDYYRDLLSEKKKTLPTNIQILETSSNDQITEEIKKILVTMKEKEYKDKLKKESEEKQDITEKNLKSHCKYGVRKRMPEPIDDDDSDIDFGSLF